MKLTIKPTISIIILLALLLFLPELITAQPMPSGPPESNPVTPVPIDPASWLIPAGMGAYAWYKKRKEGKTTTEEAVS